MKNFDVTAGDLKNYGTAVLTLFLTALGLSAVFIAGYSSDVPRGGFLIFGQAMFFSTGLEVWLEITISIITAKAALLVLGSSAAALAPLISILPRVQEESLESWVVGIVCTRFEVLLSLAALIYFARFFHFSVDAAALIFSPIVLGFILMAALDRHFLREALADFDRGANIGETEVLTRYTKHRVSLIALILSVAFYSAGIAKYRNELYSNPNFSVSGVGRLGAILSANSTSFLVAVPGKVLDEKSFFLGQRELPRWFVVTLEGHVLEIR
ncbi:hypothetical protein [Leisingera aquaemixtae]|uniref:hypothetical protein n=1 Tax=Leisingera aquaemixtae TaxID=1396826 RepID=UPI0011511E78|nr:hypothetical protein [Leisingera aquaemixtae]QDI74470.1 hypothetical protein R2C4_01375 [Leisingera aquaemixtae]